MKKKEKTKRFGVILLELVFLIVILLGIVKLKANATNNPDLHRMNTLINVSREQSSAMNNIRNLKARSFELQSHKKSSSLKDFSNEHLLRTLLNTFLLNRMQIKVKDPKNMASERMMLSQIPDPKNVEIYFGDLSSDPVLKIDSDQYMLHYTGSRKEVYNPTLEFSELGFKPFNEFSDSIPKISDPVYHKYLSPQIVLSIGKRNP